MYQALYRKYRPQLLEDICGQDTIVKIINNSIKNNRINHAYLFTGPRGTGKTSIAKIFARMVNCENLENGKPCGKCASCSQINNSDIIEIDAASNNGVDEIRELRNKINLVPAYGKYKVYIIDEVHMLTTGAFNALLKTLEEPPKHIIFVLATTDPHKIPETILSRCQRLDFKKVNENSIVKRLKDIAKLEKIQIEDEALQEIARLSDGGMRDSIGMLDQANAYTDEIITAQDIHDINGTITPEDLKEFISVITEKNIEIILKKLDFYNDCGKNFVKLTEEIVSFLRNILLCAKAPEYFKQKNLNSQLYDELTKKIETNDILDYIDSLNECLNKMKITNNPKLSLELAIIKMTSSKPTKIELKAEEKPIKTVISQEIQNKDSTPKIISQEIPNKDSTSKIISQEIPKESKSVEKLAPKPTNKTTVDYERLSQLKELRINNTLAKFHKKTVLAIKEKLNTLNNYLLDPDYSKYASMLLDGILKAASEDNLIFVYKNDRLATLFNENIINIEKTLNRVLDNNYKVIATDQDSWEVIKNDFNSKKKNYTYQEENINIEEIFKEEKQENEFSDFEDIIEYN